MRKCFLWRVSLTKPSCFCWEERFILRRGRTHPDAQRPPSLNTGVKSVKLSHTSTARYTISGTPGTVQGAWYTYKRVGRRHIYTGCVSLLHTQGGYTRHIHHCTHTQGGYTQHIHHCTHTQGGYTPAYTHLLYTTQESIPGIYSTYKP